MTSKSSAQRNLTSLAILKVNWDAGKDYIENFVPFVAQALLNSSQPEVSLPEIQSTLETEFGIIIPSGPLKTILKRAAKRGFVTRERNIYKRNDSALAKLNFSMTRETVLRQNNTLINSLVRYCQDVHDVTWSIEEAETKLLACLAHAGLPVISQNAKALSLEDFHPSKKDDFLIASFIQHLHESDATKFEYLETLVRGGMLVDALYFPEIGNIRSSFQDLEVYFDTNFLLRAMGLAGDVRRDSCIELLDLLYELNANLRCFEHTVKEMRGILSAARACLRDRGKVVTGTFETYDHLAAQGYTTSDVDIILAKLPQRISGLRVRTVATPSYSETLAIDEAKFETMLENKYGFKKEEARYKDVKSITAVHRLRGGRDFYDIDSCKAIFVTTNTELAKAAIDFFEINKEGQIPLCLPDDVFATHAWLKKPTSAPDLPRKRLAADCFAALNPSDELWTRYTKEIDRSRDSEKVSAEEYALLRYSAVAKNALMDVTRGDPEAFSEGTPQEVLDKAKAAIGEEWKKQLEEKERSLSEADQRAESARTELDIHRQRIRSMAVKVGWGTALFIKAASFALLIAGLIFTLPGVFNILDGLSTKFTVFVFLVILTVCTFANLYWGTTIKGIIRKIESWTSHKIESILLGSRQTK